jgi:hypothetical protein
MNSNWLRITGKFTLDSSETKKGKGRASTSPKMGKYLKDSFMEIRKMGLGLRFILMEIYTLESL